MPRFAWSCLVLSALALPLASCFNEEWTCPTCPAENSGRIVIRVPTNLDVDSIQVTLDGGPSYSVRRGRERSFDGLARGTHTVSAAVFRFDPNTGLPASRSLALEITLERGETRTVEFHHDFARVVLAPVPAPPAGEIVAAAPRAARSGAG